MLELGCKRVPARRHPEFVHVVWGAKCHTTAGWPPEQAVRDTGKYKLWADLTGACQLCMCCVLRDACCMLRAACCALGAQGGAGHLLVTGCIVNTYVLKRRLQGGCGPNSCMYLCLYYHTAAGERLYISPATSCSMYSNQLTCQPRHCTRRNQAFITAHLKICQHSHWNWPCGHS